MRTWHWMMTIFLLLSLSARAQDSSNPSSSPTTAQTPASGTQPSAPKLQPPSAAAQPGAAPASTAPASAPSLTVNQVVDRVIEREHALMNMLKTRTPLVETYLQNLKSDPQAGPVPVQDHYFLGRVDLGETIERRDYLPRGSGFETLFTGLFKMEYKPVGFVSMIFVDREDFDRQTYNFNYIHREFLGDVRCIVFDVSAKKGTGDGRFRGRIWVEDQNYNIVRLNGTFGPRPHHAIFFGRDAYFFHMDSWRLNLVPGYWVPTYIYSEQGDFSPGSHERASFRAQTRLWGYASQKDVATIELTQIFVDSSVKDVSPSTQDASPLEAQRQWQRQAEDNVMDRLQTAGLLAPVGEVDKVLLTGWRFSAQPPWWVVPA